MVTRFELGEQFVEFSRVDEAIHRSWGARGRGRWSRVDRYADATAASVAWKQQLQRLDRTGYQSGFHDERFESLLRANPNDIEVYRTYSDWLQEQGDPRGHFIATMLAGLPHEELLQTHADAFLPRRRELLRCTWRWGFIDHAVFSGPWHLLELFAHSSALVMRSLAIEYAYGWDAAVSLVNRWGAKLPATLTTVDLTAAPLLWARRREFVPELLRLVTPVS